MRKRAQTVVKDNWLPRDTSMRTKGMALPVKGTGVGSGVESLQRGRALKTAKGGGASCIKTASPPAIARADNVPVDAPHGVAAMPHAPAVTVATQGLAPGGVGVRVGGPSVHRAIQMEEDAALQAGSDAEQAVRGMAHVDDAQSLSSAEPEGTVESVFTGHDAVADPIPDPAPCPPQAGELGELAREGAQMVPAVVFVADQQEPDAPSVHSADSLPANIDSAKSCHDASLTLVTKAPSDLAAADLGITSSLMLVLPGGDAHELSVEHAPALPELAAEL